MKLTQKALKAINKPATRKQLMGALGCTEFTIARYIQKNSGSLTKAAALQVIRTVTGLSDSEILEDYENIPDNRPINPDTPIHIGQHIKGEVEVQQLTHKEFGALINKNEKTVPDIYQRVTIPMDLLITISQALKKDFIKLYYDKEPMKSLRVDEVSRLKHQVKIIDDEIEHLERELAFIQEIGKLQKTTILLITEQIDRLTIIKQSKLEIKDETPGNAEPNNPN
jgi:hypothetical protein